jgi:UDP-N-acetyl-D-galactosamine dehydrogenase
MRIAVIGLGYVGMPLAVALSRRFDVVGFDVDQSRVRELRSGRDRTGELDSKALGCERLHLSTVETDLAACDIYIITVPTPVDSGNRPDLTAVRRACHTVGRSLGRGAIVVLESTVYPGVTENVCGPELTASSGLVCGRDFFLGYSPERINPGDRQHTVDRITKVVSGQTPEVAEKLAQVYGAVTTGGVFVARNIMTAEAAKVIENAQRDINIAFINEVTTVFNKLGLSIYDVLAAAETKWNFLGFRPGLVGGHCIGIDPYYLAYCAQNVGHHPEVILAGRRTNDAMGQYIAHRVALLLARSGRAGQARILVLGLTFKEDVPDLRNTKVVDVVRELSALGHSIDVHDPCADPAEAQAEYEISLLPSLEGARGYDCVIGAVSHRAYAALDAAQFSTLLRPGGIVADVKGMWRQLVLSDDLVRWQL